ncbi:hypothetical protein OS242_10325 [Tumebacillus sp. DT12]|uniref:Uncharacterized protein n=1 Tax=Tumebacillus lacus TaxID=2995335 RepID=A0ABT3X0D8_9BACL|nr:hypothetical protein [Tumebacillus lacus]MCX7570359.1 hypothetical protein [Tumebacillus lacus]
MVVPQRSSHMIPRGDEPVGHVQYGTEPDKTLQLGNATVKIFAPKGLTKEEIDRRDLEIHRAVADILRSRSESAASTGA